MWRAGEQETGEKNTGRKKGGQKESGVSKYEVPIREKKKKVRTTSFKI